MLKYILCVFLGAFLGILTISLVSGNRPDDEYRDGFNDGYARAIQEFKKLP